KDGACGHVTATDPASDKSRSNWAVEAIKLRTRFLISGRLCLAVVEAFGIGEKRVELRARRRECGDIVDNARDGISVLVVRCRGKVCRHGADRDRIERLAIRGAGKRR